MKTKFFIITLLTLLSGTIAYGQTDAVMGIQFSNEEEESLTIKDLDEIREDDEYEEDYEYEEVEEVEE